MKFVCVRSTQQLLCAGVAVLAAMGAGVGIAENKVLGVVSAENTAAAGPTILARNEVNCGESRSPQIRCPAGGLFVTTQNGGREQVFPLKRTEVKAKIAGNISRVEVVQKFENPFNEPLDAVYVFPLPDEAAVDDMEIKIADRTIKADIKRRDEALEIYEKARRQGFTAGLLEQERDNIFTQSLANIKPGETIEVTIRYTESLNFTGGDYEFVFPMVVGPRYISRNSTPPNPPLARGGDASNSLAAAGNSTPPNPSLARGGDASNSLAAAGNSIPLNPPLLRGGDSETPPLVRGGRGGLKLMPIASIRPCCLRELDRVTIFRFRWK